MPALTGNGLAMRAGMMLEALAGDSDAYLLVIPVVAAPFDAVDRRISSWCARIAIHPVARRVDPLFRLIARIKDPRERLAAHASYPRPSLCRFATTGSVHDAAQLFEGIVFREVHVFRLYMAPFAEPYLRASPAVRPACRLDLDDHESRTRRRLADLYDAAGETMAASLERLEAAKYSAMERQYLPLFDRVYVASSEDRLEIIQQPGYDNTTVIPNAVRLPAATPPRRAHTPFTFLFVGTLGYYPNEDAALFFCSEILPRLRQTAGKPFRVLIVGANPSPRVRALSAHPEVTVTGMVPDLTGYYRDADAVVLPLRAGGGTRIKLLEAFSYRRPVVCTTFGAEGIDARHQVHLLIGDTPDDFAKQCLPLMETPALGRELAARAYRFVRTNHSPERIRELLRRDHRSG